jgi:hypothetical protein
MAKAIVGDFEKAVDGWMDSTVSEAKGEEANQDRQASMFRACGCSCLEL